MKKTLITFVATTLVSASAMAGSIAVEVRQGNLIKGVNSAVNSTEWRVEAWDKVAGFDAGVELQSKQAQHRGAVDSAVSLKAGKSVEVVGVKVLPYAEYGTKFVPANDFNFYGVGVKASYKLVDRVNVNAGYRHRGALDTVHNMNENRVNVGASVDLTKAVSFGAGLYRTYGTSRDTTYGLSVARSF